MNAVIDRPAIVAAPSSIAGAAGILTPEALDFLGGLHRRFNQRRLSLLAARAERQRRFDDGELPDFPAATADFRE